MRRRLTANAARRNALGAMIVLMRLANCSPRCGHKTRKWRNHLVFQPELSSCCKPMMDKTLVLPGPQMKRPFLPDHPVQGDLQSCKYPANTAFAASFTNGKCLFTIALRPFFSCPHPYNRALAANFLNWMYEGAELWSNFGIAHVRLFYRLA